MRKRTLCVDVDDTISTTYNRDYVNSLPIEGMIEKLNKLYLEGWEVIYFTARGQLSTGYNIAEIERTRRPVLEAWLKKHNVLYTQLIMGKPFADYYIDDKAMTPDDFMQTTFGQKLEGRSGAEVSRVNDLVIKVCDNAQMQVDWLNYWEEVLMDDKWETSFLTPKIVDSAPSVYRMKYVEPKDKSTKVTGELVLDWVDTILQFQELEPLEGYGGTFESYVTRSTRMLNEDLKEQVLSIAEHYPHMDQYQSFCHGDLTLDNIIVTHDIHAGPMNFMIDPSIQKGVWSSWLIDVGRFMQSFHSRYEEMFKGADVDSTKEIYIDWFLDQVGVTKEDAVFMEILIYCRILHHQYNHSERDGRITEQRLEQLIELWNNLKG